MDRRHALASPLIVACEVMPPLESADRHSTPSQKLPTSKQQTPPAAPPSAPLFRLLRFLPLCVNLFPINQPSQTGDSNLVVNKTIDRRHMEKVPQEKTRRDVLASPPLVAFDERMLLRPADRHPTPSQKSPTSKHPTPPAAPASVPTLSSVSIAPSSLSLNLSYINPPLQTGDGDMSLRSNPPSPLEWISSSPLVSVVLITTKGDESSTVVVWE